MEEKKKLYRIDNGKMIAGVCKGFAEYFNIDVTIVRLAWVALTLFVGFGIIGYILAMIIMPYKKG